MSYMLSSELANSFVCGAIAHPSIVLEQYVHGRKPTDLVAKVTKPMLLLPAQVYFFPYIYARVSLQYIYDSISLKNAIRTYIHTYIHTQKRKFNFQHSSFPLSPAERQRHVPRRGGAV